MTDEGKQVDPVAQGCGLGCLGLIAIFVVFMLWGSIAGDDEPDVPDQYEAKAQCEGFADKRLKAPATADYDLAAVESAESWTVTGTVDSENGFGAMIRSEVRCVLHFAGDTAYLDDISID